MNSNMTLSRDEQFIDAYLKAYETGYEQSSGKSHAARKRSAKTYAAEVCPNGTMALMAWGKCASQQKTPESMLELSGQKIAVKFESMEEAGWKVIGRPAPDVKKPDPITPDPIVPATQVAIQQPLPDVNLIAVIVAEVMKQFGK